MCERLRRDIYDLRVPSYSIAEVIRPKPDPLDPVRYPCFYWVQHLLESSPAPNAARSEDIDLVHKFLSQKYLYWLEALSLLRGVSDGVAAMIKLETLFEVRHDDMTMECILTLSQENSSPRTSVELVRDARRFIMYHKHAIEHTPLQLYVSALIFSPSRSLIRSHFKHEEPGWVTIKPPISDEWSTCLLTLEGHTNYVQSLAFSHDSALLASASASADNTIKIWDMNSGACLHTLEGGDTVVVVFSHDSIRLASASYSTIRVWDVASGTCSKLLHGHSLAVKSVCFSHDSVYLASGSYDRTIKIWDVANGACLQTLKGHEDYVRTVAFSRDSKLLASASFDTVMIWDVASGICLQALTKPSTDDDGDEEEGFTCLTFSTGSNRLIAICETEVQVWDVDHGTCLQTFKDFRGATRSLAVLRDSVQVVISTWLATVEIWDVTTDRCLRTLGPIYDDLGSVIFSPGSNRLAGVQGNLVKIWDTTNTKLSRPAKKKSLPIKYSTFSPDSTLMATTSYDHRIKIWDSRSAKCLRSLEGHRKTIRVIVFSHDNSRLVSGANDMEVKIWDGTGTRTGEACLRRIKTFNEGESADELDPAIFITFLHDSAHVALAVGDTIKIWNTTKNTFSRVLEGHDRPVRSLAFFSKQGLLSSASSDKTIKIWNPRSGTCLQTLRGHDGSVASLAAFSKGSNNLASASYDNTIKIWDVESGACLRTFQTGSILWRHISFNVLTSHLNTERGTIEVGTLLSPPSSVEMESLEVVQYQGPGLGPDGTWITVDSENAIWLPSECRQRHSDAAAVVEQTIWLSDRSGKVWICVFDPEKYRKVFGVRT